MLGSGEVGAKQGVVDHQEEAAGNARRKMLMTAAKSLVLITTEGDHRSNLSNYNAMQLARERSHALLFCAQPQLRL